MASHEAAGSSPRDPELAAGIISCSDFVYRWGLRERLPEADAAEMRQIACASQ